MSKKKQEVQVAAIQRWFARREVQGDGEMEQINGVPIRDIAFGFGDSASGYMFDGRHAFAQGRTTGTERLARFERASTRDRPALVRMALPNQLTYKRSRLMVETLEAMGATVFYMPEGVQDQASIMTESIEVVDTDPTWRFPRGRQQLLRARVNFWGSWRSKPRQAYFLSGYDQNERGNSYFFCELPPGVKPETVREAYHFLKPESVLKAEQRGMYVIRQGDMFFIRMRDFQNSEELARAVEENLLVQSLRLHRSNHYAERGFRIGKLHYVTGKITHEPDGRRPDHKPLRLGRWWYLCVPNTVPTSNPDW